MNGESQFQLQIEVWKPRRPAESEGDSSLLLSLSLSAADRPFSEYSQSRRLYMAGLFCPRSGCNNYQQRQLRVLALHTGSIDVATLSPPPSILLTA